ncbi:MAG: SUMF1/EgtB/PvdO family nonheme iron enzyme, partial [Candidatus Coatesbacteria bacterium]|nr:SUMF1/EgtB/PvdO family nonheme iron enzyme [Candidatus Coatesbacteria bacterium]
MKVAACVLLPFLAIAAATASAAPTVTVTVNGSEYESSDRVELSLSASNDHEAMSVDVYVGLILPGGEIWSTQWDGWRHLIEPWVSDIYVPEYFDMPPATFWTFELPSELPPVKDDGDYSFAALLTYPGTFDWICNASLAPFSYSVGFTTDITMLPMPAGSFLMGSPDNEVGRDESEGPQRTVNISAFEMSETEITQLQWTEVMGWNDSLHDGDDTPVENISWFDMVSFCNILSAAKDYDLC